MEQLQIEQNRPLEEGAKVFLSASEAEEYRAFKRQKRIREVETSFLKSEVSALSRGEGVSSLRFSVESAKRLNAFAVKVNPTGVALAKRLLSGSKTSVDCVVGGTGESFLKTKVFETKLARKSGAKEISLRPSLFAIKNGRFSEVKKEIKKVQKAAKKSTVKVIAERALCYNEILVLGKILSVLKGKFLSVEYFEGCEKLKRDLLDGCMLEVTGVKDAEVYRRLVSAGVERVVSDRAEELYHKLLDRAKERPVLEFEPPKAPVHTSSKEPLNVVADKKLLTGFDK